MWRSLAVNELLFDDEIDKQLYVMMTTLFYVFGARHKSTYP